MVHVCCVNKQYAAESLNDKMCAEIKHVAICYVRADQWLWVWKVKGVCLTQLYERLFPKYLKHTLD